jgi:hypothetical protein
MQFRFVFLLLVTILWLLIATIIRALYRGRR